MHLHILGICGTFMGGVAALARAAGHRVTGSDDNVYPPMSTQLADLGIAVTPSDDLTPLDADPDIVVVGNVMRRGHALIEAMLDRDIAYSSGPQWMAENVLGGRRVIACAGTHGKTTTASLATSLLRNLGEDPGFLIGGVAPELGVSAHLGSSPTFVIEADEYDTAFFDKRAKFVHYRPEVAILGNLEFDHADIYPDLAAIARQMHHFVRTVPGRGRLVINQSSAALADVLAMGAWTPVTTFGTEPGACDVAVVRERINTVSVHVDGQRVADVAFELLGQHNLENAAAAIAAITSMGFEPAAVATGLAEFRGVKRRLEPLLELDDITLFDDFAHHPTAIRRTLAGLAAAWPGRRVIVALEPRSNTMRSGVHGRALGDSLKGADHVLVARPPRAEFDLSAALAPVADTCDILDDYDALRSRLLALVRPKDIVVLMSNGGFGDLRQRLPQDLARQFQGH
ncbi:MAG: UDP-N-acetylmuramate:L-alanyl-gamma-D-glutamyl-meso-diaminopimelate ligase [Pseudomonadota bacterium]